MAILPNAVYETDALTLLERLRSDSVALVYLDMPFQILSAGFVYSDGEAADLTEHLEFHSKLYQQVHRILSPRGVVVQHVDRAFSTQTRLVLEQEFGLENYRHEFIMPLRHRSPIRKGSDYERILMFSKTDNYLYNPPSRIRGDNELAQLFRNRDAHGNYRLVDVTVPGESPHRRHLWNGILPPSGRSWRYPIGTLNDMLASDRLEVDSNRRRVRAKQYQEEVAEIPVGEVWDDLSQYAPISEQVSFSSQRSNLLASRIIGMSTEPGDIVVDPFCGSGTTLIVAESLGRHWIGGDISSMAVALTRDRLIKAGSVGFEFGDETVLDEIEPEFALYRLPDRPQQRRHLILGKSIDLEEDRKTEFKEIRGNNPVGSVSGNADEYAVAFLNSEGGRIYWGVRDDRHVVGVRLNYAKKDEVKRVVEGKLAAVRPELPTGFYRLEFIPLLDEDGSEMQDLHVIELSIPRVASRNLFFTQGNKCFIRTAEGTKRELTGLSLVEEIRQRDRETV